MPRDSDRQDRRQLDDDVLTGFSKTGERKGEFRGFFATILVGSLYVWGTMFEIGAYHTVFFIHLDAYLILSTVTLAGLLIVRHEVEERLWLVVACTPPAALLLFRLATPDKDPGGVLMGVGIALIVVNVVALPLLAWLIARMLAPEVFEVRERRLRVATAAILAGAALAGYLAGEHNSRYLTCHDFVVAGLDKPTGCRDTNAHN